MGRLSLGIDQCKRLSINRSQCCKVCKFNQKSMLYNCLSKVSTFHCSNICLRSILELALQFRQEYIHLQFLCKQFHPDKQSNQLSMEHMFKFQNFHRIEGCMMINRQTFIILFLKCMMCKQLLKYRKHINYHSRYTKNYLIYINLSGMIEHISFWITRKEKHNWCINLLKNLCMIRNLMSKTSKFRDLYSPSKYLHIDQPKYSFLISKRIQGHTQSIEYQVCIIHMYQGIINICRKVNISHRCILERRLFLLINILLNIHCIS